MGSQREIVRNSLPYMTALASSIVRKLRQPRSEMARERRRFFIIPAVFKSSKITVWFSRINLVDSLCKKSVRVSFTLAWTLATLKRAFSRRLLPFCLRARLRWHFLSRFSFAFKGLGDLIFSPVLKVAKSMMPRSIPTDCPLSANCCGSTSTTKLKKYRLALSLITVTELGIDGKGRLQTTSRNPIFAR